MPAILQRSIKSKQVCMNLLLLASRLISIKRRINIFTEYSALFTRTRFVGLVSHSNQIIKNADWWWVQETARCPTRRQHMVLGILLIQVVDWLVCHCHPAVSQTACTTLSETTRLKTTANINIHDEPFLLCFSHVVSALHGADGWVSCECHNNLRSDSCVLWKSLLVIHTIVIHPGLSFFPLFFLMHHWCQQLQMAIFNIPRDTFDFCCFGDHFLNLFQNVASQDITPSALYYYLIVCSLVRASHEC